MAFNTSRTSTSPGRPPRLAGGIAGSTSAHSASVRSLGYRRPRRFAARRCSGVHIAHPLASIRVLDNESHPILPTQQLPGSALSGIGNSLDNFMIGNNGNNSLNGGAGNDRIDAHFGNDTLYGGPG